MPLRDHFRPPVSKRSSWEGFHGYWSGAMVRVLAKQLPDGYVAEPRVHLGVFYEIDVCAYDEASEAATSRHGTNGGVAVAPCAPPAPTFAMDVEIPEH